MVPTPLYFLDDQLVYYEHFIRPNEAAVLFRSLQHDVPWQQERIRMMGKWVLQPRLTAWYGDSEARYTYAGLLNEPLPWLPSLAELRLRIESEFESPFNSVLLNLYRDGRDYMGWHSDNEPSLGAAPVIASLSLGVERRFSFRRRSVPVCARRANQSMDERTDLCLSSGSLLLMRAGVQNDYKHALPKALRVREPRINLTFRCIVPV